MDYGHAIRTILSEKGLKQKDLVDNTELSQTSISKIMNGHHIPSDDSINKLAKVLNVPAEIIHILAIDLNAIPAKHRDLFLRAHQSLTGACTIYFFNNKKR